MPTRKRTDVHRPSAIRPEDYTYLDSMDLEEPLNKGDQGPGGLYETIARAENSSADHSASIGQCDHCGAYLRYVVFWEHTPTGEVITTGLDCARETMNVPNRLLLDQKRLRETAAARRRAIKESQEVIERRERARELFPEAVEILDDYQGGIFFVADIAARFGRHGYLSPGQAEAVVKAVREREERLAKWRAENDEPDPTPVPVNGERIEITGKVIKTDTIENDFGTRHVMTVLDDRGFKVWGTEPRGLVVVDEDGARGLRRGDRVTFTAKVEPSSRDETFGFFSRPTKARVLEEVAA